jgi:hypothetical protein
MSDQSIKHFTQALACGQLAGMHSTLADFLTAESFADVFTPEEIEALDAIQRGVWALACNVSHRSKIGLGIEQDPSEYN